MMVMSQPHTVFIVRHGERLDHVCKQWHPDPADGIPDPPLSSRGYAQACQTGTHLTSQMEALSLDVADVTVIIYTSPFQRCIDTAIGLIQGMKLDRPPILRIDLGLGEWMCERFFDEVCPAAHFISRQQEALARRQALSYAVRATIHRQTNDASRDTNELRQHLLPPMMIDFGHQSVQDEFIFPESYTDMLQRFDETRSHCLAQSLTTPPKPHATPCPHSTVVVFVTHAVGVNALLDGFRNQKTRLVETNYCSVSCVQWATDKHTPLFFPISQWAIRTEVSSEHLSDTPDTQSPPINNNNNNNTFPSASAAAPPNTPSAIST